MTLAILGTAALIIPNDFSQNQAAFQTPKPTSPNIEIFINEGMNATAARMAGQMLSGITENISHNLSMQLLVGFEKQGENISPKQAALLVDPLTVTVTNVNAVGTNSANGNAPVSFIQPLWMSSIVGAAIVFFSIKKMKIVNRRASILSKLTQIFSGVLLSFIARPKGIKRALSRFFSFWMNGMSKGEFLTHALALFYYLKPSFIKNVSY